MISICAISKLNNKTTLETSACDCYNHQSRTSKKHTSEKFLKVDLLQNSFKLSEHKVSVLPIGYKSAKKSTTLGMLKLWM